jgi:site-specific DNA recombinase
MSTRNPIKWAGVYLRRSTNGNSQERSLVTQRAELERFAVGEGYLIGEQHWFSDDALSGGRDDRPGFQAIMAAADRREFDVLLCYNSDRLSRQDPQDLAPYWARLNTAGVELHSVTEGLIETKTFEGFLMAIVRQKGKADYLEAVATHVAKGLRAVRLEGKWTAPTPLGYSKDADLYLHVDPESAKTVKQMFRWRAAGRGYVWIAQELTRQGIRPSRADAWSGQSVGHKLCNELYVTGEKSVSMHSRAQHQKLVETPQVVKVAEPIIDRELWDAVRKLDGRQASGHWKGDSYGAALSGLCNCETCGSLMYAMKNHGE